MLTKNKVHNCIVYLLILTGNNPYLDLANVHVYAKFGLFLQFVLKKFSRNEILKIIKDHNSVVNFRKSTPNN